MALLTGCDAYSTRVGYVRENGTVPVLGSVDQVAFNKLRIHKPNTFVEIADDITFDSVTSIHIKYTTCFYFPQGFRYYFPGILAITVEKSKLKAITKTDLQPFDLLKVLSLKGNQLTRLESRLFVFNPEVAYASFENNRIRSISAELYADTMNTPKIELADNVCITRKTVLLARSEIEDEILLSCQIGRNRLSDSESFRKKCKNFALNEIFKTMFEKTWLPALVESGAFWWYWVSSKAIGLTTVVSIGILFGFLLASLMESVYEPFLRAKMYVRRIFRDYCDNFVHIMDNDEQ